MRDDLLNPLGLTQDDQDRIAREVSDELFLVRAKWWRYLKRDLLTRVACGEIDLEEAARRMVEEAARRMVDEVLSTAEV